MTANIEYAPPDVLREAQNAGLQQMIKHAMRVEFYRQPLTSYGLASATLTVDDLPRLPCTHKEDLRSHYPYGLWACRREDVVEIHASSGTTGKPTVVGYTAADLRTWKLATVSVVEPGSMERSQGKARRVFDQRGEQT